MSSLKIDAHRMETAALNTQIHKELLEDFKTRCKQLEYPMNVMIETFMQQYANERFYLDPYDITKWKADDYELETLNTTFNKEIYTSFKKKCKDRGFFVKHVIMAFMETYLSTSFVLEFIEKDKIKEEVTAAF